MRRGGAGGRVEKRLLVVLGVMSAAVPLEAQPAACTVSDAGPSAGPSQLYADCPGSSLRLGEATSYTSAANAAAGLLVVVRQTTLGTEVDLVKQSLDGSTQFDELSGEIRQGFAQAGAGRPQSFSVDLTVFQTTGLINASALAGLGKFQINLLGRTLLTPAS